MQYFFHLAFEYYVISYIRLYINIINLILNLEGPFTISNRELPRTLELEKINSRMLNRRERQTPNYVSQSVKDFEYSKRKRRPRSKLTKNPRKTTSLTKLRKSWSTNYFQDPEDFQQHQWSGSIGASLFVDLRFKSSILETRFHFRW